MTDETPAQISVQELAAWRQEGRTLTLLDVREPWEIEIARLDGAQEIPLRQLPARNAELPRDQPLVVFCHLGGRSGQAVAWLRSQGLLNAINLSGGIDAWAKEVDETMGVY